MAQAHSNDIIFTEDALKWLLHEIRRKLKENYKFYSTIDIENKNGVGVTIDEQHVMQLAEQDGVHGAICIFNEELENYQDKPIWLTVEASFTFGQEVESEIPGCIKITHSGVTMYPLVKGFDRTGSFDNSTEGDERTTKLKTDILLAKQIGDEQNPVWDMYVGNFHISPEGGELVVHNATEAYRFTPTEGEGDPAAGTPIDDINLLKGSIRTLGGIAAGKTIKAAQVYAAVFNDYAECRQTIDLSPGHVVIDNDDGSLSCSSARLQSGAQVISDTYGNIMGETPKCRTPIAVAGRVLVYPYQNRESYHAGMAVCSAPDGTVDIMTREEIRDYPDCIVGIVSEIPQYEKWGSNQVDVDGRIWIKVK